MISPARPYTILLTAVLLISACNNAKASGDSPSAERSAENAQSTKVSDNVVVTGQADRAPEGCDVPEVAQRLLDFADAYNHADPDMVPTFFSDAAPFAWYSAPDAVNPAGTEVTAVESVNELPAYFERREAQHEQLTFKQIQVNGWEAQRGLVHFQFTVSRQADDLNGSVALEVIGKGAIHCQTQTFVAIFIGDAR